MRDKDPILWFADPLFCDNKGGKECRESFEARSDAIDREIDRIIDEARFKQAVLVAKAQIIDDLRAALEGYRG
jgi:hypothetical protein